jgi:hypothetical protein
MEDDVDIINLDGSEITPATPKLVKKSPKEKRKKKWKRPQWEADGQLVIKLKNAGSTRLADAMEADGRPDGTAEIL